MITVKLIPVLQDNYAYLIRTSSGHTAVLDPGESGPVIDVLENEDLSLDYILITHHHGDHTGGVMALKQRYDCPVAAPKAEAARIQDADTFLEDGDVFTLGEDTFKIIATPGHTAGAICYHCPASKAVFTGDTLFSLGCGRLFEGSAQEMFDSLEKLKALPDDTQIYCGHEYTRSNADFCLSIDPDNQDLQQRAEDINRLCANNTPTIPATIELEKKTNPFLRTKNSKEFAALRQKKDNF